MNSKQKVLLSIFLPLSALIVILDNVFPGADMVNYFKFATVCAVFLASLKIAKRYREQVVLNVAVFFAVVGDFFLNLCSTVPELAVRVVPFGISGFLLAYILLIVVFHKKYSASWKELLAAVPVLAVFIPNLIILHPYVSGYMLWGTLLFGLVLCFMAWTSIGAMFRGYFRMEVSWRVALAGYLMFISDMGVANSLFNPAFAGHFVPWLENIIWGAYVPAWTLIAVTIAEDELFKNPVSI